MSYAHICTLHNCRILCTRYKVTDNHHAISWTMYPTLATVLCFVHYWPTQENANHPTNDGGCCHVRTQQTQQQTELRHGARPATDQESTAITSSSHPSSPTHTNLANYRSLQTECYYCRTMQYHTNNEQSARCRCPCRRHQATTITCRRQQYAPPLNLAGLETP